MRWKYGVPPAGNANFAWVQHFIHHLAPTGMAGFVLANGSMSSNQSGEGEIRKASSRPTWWTAWSPCPASSSTRRRFPVCLWFLARDKKNGRFRDRRGETLFIDARKLGTLIDRVHRELTDEDIAKIAGTYHAWRGDKDAGEYADIPGFCKAAKLDESPRSRPRPHARPLCRCRGAQEDDGEPFAEKMKRLRRTLEEQFAEGAKLEKQLREHQKNLGSQQRATTEAPPTPHQKPRGGLTSHLKRVRAKRNGEGKNHPLGGLPFGVARRAVLTLTFGRPEGVLRPPSGATPPRETVWSSEKWNSSPRWAS